MRCRDCDGNLDGSHNLCVCPDEDLLGYVGASTRYGGHVKYTRDGGPYLTIEQAKKYSRCEVIRELRLGKIVK